MDIEQQRTARKVGKRIRTARIESGMNQVELAAKIDVPQSTVSKWERGVNIPGGTNLTRLSLALGLPTKEIIGAGVEDTTPGRRVRVIGSLAAGDFSEAIEWPVEDQFDMPLIVPDDMLNLPLNGFRVDGPSMNKMYPDGSIVYVAPLHALPDAPKHEDVVMVMRRDSHGFVEGTLKQYMVGEDGKKWLWPRSNHPEHQAPIDYLGKKRGKVEEVQITGVVMAALVFPGR